MALPGTIEELKVVIGEPCQENVCLDSFGYIEPGHGAKGKQRWLTCDEGLNNLYVAKKRSFCGAIPLIRLLRNELTLPQEDASQILSH